MVWQVYAIMGAVNVAQGLIKRQSAKAQAQANYQLTFYNLVHESQVLALQQAILQEQTFEGKMKSSLEALATKGQLENTGSKRSVAVNEFWMAYQDRSAVDQLYALRQSRLNLQARSENEESAMNVSIPKIGDIFLGAGIKAGGSYMASRY